ncbi:putative mitochondrial protein [Andalucia godoyi]|uniref:Putative mitochondrial protein n=1 Tax=Andalucia godoyi TaxID=505711 RepID=A0A8K0AJL0_ANDGO|nr:putative mitochondrial protein [Andalucia godoyi]|eukprot:ANDGO_04831.mRNA.1 putative mitochondrial protein
MIPKPKPKPLQSSSFLLPPSASSAASSSSASHAAPISSSSSTTSSVSTHRTFPPPSQPQLQPRMLPVTSGSSFDGTNVLGALLQSSWTRNDLYEISSMVVDMLSVAQSQSQSQLQWAGEMGGVCMRLVGRLVEWSREVEGCLARAVEANAVQDAEVKRLLRLVELLEERRMALEARVVVLTSVAQSSSSPAAAASSSCCSSSSPADGLRKFELRKKFGSVEEAVDCVLRMQGSASRIQRVWRGGVARKRFRDMCIQVLQSHSHSHSHSHSPSSTSLSSNRKQSRKRKE